MYIRAREREELKMREVSERIMLPLIEKEKKLRSAFGRGEDKLILNIDSEVLMRKR